LAFIEPAVMPALLNMLEKGPVETIGDVPGEKEKFCW
jgi:hypothetical protein